MGADFLIGDLVKMVRTGALGVITSHSVGDSDYTTRWGLTWIEDHESPSPSWFGVQQTFRTKKGETIYITLHDLVSSFEVVSRGAA